MKKLILLLMAVSFMISMVACSGKQESKSNESDASQASMEVDESITDEVDDSITESESASEVKEDYSSAKAQVDAFNERISGYTQDIISDDRSASWIVIGSNNDYNNGGRYDGNWKIYVVNEEIKKYSIMGAFYETYPKTDDTLAYDYSIRTGNGTYKIYVIYQNDEKDVYFYAEEEVVLDDTTIHEYKGKSSFVYNVTDLVGADFTSRTFQLDHE